MKSPEVREHCVSLVIPVKDEALTIDELIESLSSQTYPPDEILFIDGSSKDETVKILHQANLKDGRIRVIEAGEATPGRGRNIGIAAAKHDWIALTDAGIRLEPVWLEKLMEAAGCDPDVVFVYGNYEALIETYFERCAALCYLPPKRQTPGGMMRWPFIASSLIRREVWESVGGFPDLRAAEDLIFMKRIEERGFKIGWAPEATVWWKLRPTLGATFRKFALYSKHNVLAGWQRYWHYGVAKQYLVAFILVCLTLIHSSWWLAVLWIGFAARVAKSIWTRREDRSWLQLINPLQFICVGGILLTIDAATFFGWGQALWVKLRRRNRQD